MSSQFSHVDLGLLRKYDRPGPRYTSYPTAPLFSQSFIAEDYRREIIATNTSESISDISLYFHFPFCDTLCYFCGCTMMVTRDRNRIAEYNGYLKKEIDTIADRITTVRREIGRDIALNEVRARVAEGYGSAFGVSLAASSFTADERAAIAKLEREKYLTDEWVNQTTAVPDAHGSAKIKTPAG
ncbi:MAG: hypothetical protein AAB344_05800, partial [Bacteroidota bacterium]